jgi:hypothetical protein
MGIMRIAYLLISSPEDVMKTALLVLAVTALTNTPPDEGARRAVAAIEKAGGKATTDPKAPGQPVVAVDL